MAIRNNDPERRMWDNSDWKEYEQEDREFSEKFRSAIKEHCLWKIDKLISEGKGYYHFPNIDDLKTPELESSGLYLYVKSKEHLFYHKDD